MGWFAWCGSTTGRVTRSTFFSSCSRHPKGTNHYSLQYSILFTRSSRSHRSLQVTHTVTSRHPALQTAATAQRSAARAASTSDGASVQRRSLSPSAFCPKGPSLVTQQPLEHQHLHGGDKDGADAAQAEQDAGGRGGDRSGGGARARARRRRRWRRCCRAAAAAAAASAGGPRAHPAQRAGV